jgi:hypothetical protein
VPRKRTFGQRFFLIAVFPIWWGRSSGPRNGFGTASELGTRFECGGPGAAFPRLERLAVPLSHALNQYGEQRRAARARTGYQ